MAHELCTCGHQQSDHQLGVVCNRWQCRCQRWTPGRIELARVIQIVTAQPTPGDEAAAYARKPWLFGLDEDGDPAFWDWETGAWCALRLLGKG